MNFLIMYTGWNYFSVNSINSRVAYLITLFQIYLLVVQNIIWIEFSDRIKYCFGKRVLMVLLSTMNFPIRIYN